MSERSHRAMCHLVPRLLFIGLLIINTASGEAVYKWRDEREVTHFSQKSPRKLPQGLEIIELDAPRAEPHALNDYYSVINLARRVEEDRRNRERENLLRNLRPPAGTAEIRRRLPRGRRRGHVLHPGLRL